VNQTDGREHAEIFKIFLSLSGLCQIMRRFCISLLRALRQGDWLTLARLRGYCLILLLAYGVTIIVWVGLADGLKDKAGNPLGTDFVNVYAAGRMAQQGRPAAVYDWSAHQQVESEIIGYQASYYGWHYPPLFLGIAALVALLPYGWALILYLAGGIAAYLAALRRILPRSHDSLLALAAFPGLFVTIGNGQNGLITTALLGGGLYLMETRPWLGGILLGALAYKPQFFIVIPVVLLCSRQWRPLIASLCSAIFLSALSLLAFGMASWRAFFASTRLTQKLILEQGAAGWGKIQSLFATLRAFNLDLHRAYAAQAVLAAAALIVTIALWRGKTSHATRAAALCATILCATPYLFDYDLTVLAVPVALLAAQGLRTGFVPYEKSLLALLWLWPFVARIVSLNGVSLTTPLLLTLLGLCVYRARQPLNTNPNAKMPA